MAADDESEDRIQLSVAQVAASSLAALSAAVVCSFFGVAGTIIGAAVTSLLATVGSALYAHSLRRTKARIRRLHQAGANSPPITEVVRTAREQGRRLISQLPVKLIGGAAIAVFVVSIGVVTVIELGVGEPMAAIFGVSHSGNRKASLLWAVDAGPHRAKSKPKATPTPSKSTASPPSSPTAHPTATKTVTPSQTPTPTPTPTVTPRPTLTLPIPHPTPSRT